MTADRQLSPFWLLVLLTACGHAPAEARGPTPFPEHPEGLWYDTRSCARAALMSPEERAEMNRLGNIGYVEAAAEPPTEVGVTLWNRERAEAGLNLYCSGHGAEAVLMDMDGEVLHRWSYPYEEIDDAPPLAEPYQGAWRRVHLLADGSLLAIHEGLAIVKVDRDSRLLWHRVLPVHHDFDVAENDHVLVLTREARDEPRLCATAPILADGIAELDARGGLVRRISLVEALWKSHWSSLLVEAARNGGDILHANTLEILRDSPRVPHAAFRPGRVLVCFRELGAIAVVDLALERVEWLQRGPWVRPHQPSVLPNGQLMVFDNMGNGGYSRVVAYDVAQDSIVWEYAGEPAESFFSIFSGSAQRLPGGNTLVTESYAGRAFEITPGGEKVWEFVSPHRAGAESELVAVLFDVVRLSPADRLAWLH
jgi:hypothetical protein